MRPRLLIAACVLSWSTPQSAQAAEKVVDLPTRPGVTQRLLFTEVPGVTVAVVDAPSDKQSPPYLNGFRQRLEHVADLQAVIAWLRETAKAPVWLVGTSRGTQSAAHVATSLEAPHGPDGVVLTATILIDPRGRPVTAMPMERLRMPVLVVHHEQDACSHCPYSEVPALMGKLGGAPRSQAIGMTGGTTRGDPCEAASYHGFNGIEAEVVQKTVAWMLAK